MKFSLTGFVFSFMILPIAIVANPPQKNLSEASIPNPTQKSDFRLGQSLGDR